MIYIGLDMEGVLRSKNWIVVADKEGRLDFDWTTCDEMGRFVEEVEF